MKAMQETTTAMINNVTAHLHSLNNQGYTVCAVNLTSMIVNAAIALGLHVCGGQYDADTQTRVLYID